VADKRFQRSLAGGNAGDPEQVRKKGEQVEFARARRLNGWRYLLSNPLGRELAWGLIEDCHVFTAIMNTSPFIFEAAGRHDWGLQMYAEMTEADEENTLLMQKEAIMRKRSTPDAPKKPTDEDSPDA
jgi:hypothetical protein